MSNDSCNCLLHDLVPLVRPRQGTLERPRHCLRRRQHRDAAGLPAKLVELTGGYTVPQIVIGEKPIGGFRELRALDASGELAELLAA